MLKIKIVLSESYDEETEMFSTEEVEVELEHSLLALSKWESIYEKPFLSSATPTPEEFLEYIACMVITPGLSPEVLQKLSDENVKEINNYIGSSQSATTFPEKSPGAKNQQIITAELIYYWMLQAGISKEFENWHLNRLFSLLRVFAIMNDPDKNKKKPMDAAAMDRRAALNEERMRQMGTTG